MFGTKQRRFLNREAESHDFDRKCQRVPSIFLGKGKGNTSEAPDKIYIVSSPASLLSLPPTPKSPDDVFPGKNPRKCDQDSSEQDLLKFLVATWVIFDFQRNQTSNPNSRFGQSVLFYDFSKFWEWMGLGYCILPSLWAIALPWKEGEVLFFTPRATNSIHWQRCAFIMEYFIGNVCYPRGSNFYSHFQWTKESFGSLPPPLPPKKELENVYACRKIFLASPISPPLFQPVAHL